MWKLFFLKTKYIIKRFFFFFLNVKIIRICLSFLYYLLEYFLTLKDYIQIDIYIFRLKMEQWKDIYLSFSFFKHVLFIFLLITGVIPLLLFIYFLFFFLKYIFRYIFITLDFFFYLRNFNYFQTYTILKKKINNFFIIIPDFLLKIYRYFFGGGWIRFFWTKFKNYWINKWFKFLASFFSITDDIILVKSPKIYSKLKEKIIDFYYWLIKVFFILQRKFKDFFRFFRNIFSRILRRIKRKNRRAKRVYDKWFRKYYYLWYFRYIRSYIYYAWIFRKYIWSEVFIVTLEAFFFISFWNSVARVKYSIALLYTSLEYIFCKIIYSFLQEIIFTEIYLANFFEYLNYEWRGLKVDIRFYWLEFVRWVFFNISVVVGQLIYASPYAWYEWKDECYEVDKGYISLMWYSLKFYAIIQRFFRRLYPLPLRLFFFNRKIENLAFVITYEYLIRILLRRFRQDFYHRFFMQHRYKL